MCGRRFTPRDAVARRIGMSPASVVPTVISFGRLRRSAPSITASESTRGVTGTALPHHALERLLGVTPMPVPADALTFMMNMEPRLPVKY